MNAAKEEEDDVPLELRDRRYRGLRVLGRGAQATTFEATDVKDGRPVAIKRFVVRGAKSWKEVELAEREARVLAGISHPLIPAYVEHFEEGGALYLVTSKIDGESLAAIRSRGGAFDEVEVAKMLRDLGDALAYLHQRSPPIVHRDVKPGNIIRTPQGRYVLVDFGAVQARLRPAGGSTVVGTFGYMAPEQFQGRARAGSDVYSVGATALAMLTGIEPEELPHRGLAIDVRAALGKRAPESLVHALEQMVEPDPDRRPERVPLAAEPASAASRPREAQTTSRQRERARASRAAHEGRFEERLDRARREMLGKLDDKWRKREVHDARKQVERETREIRRQAKRARKREEHRHRARVAGGLTRTVVLMGLLVATISVQLACRAIVPGVLVALSVIFGENLRRAARVVSAAGERATVVIGRARERVTGLRLPDEERFDDSDLDSSDDESVRIAPLDHDAGVEVESELELDAEDEAEEARQRSTRRRR